MVDDARLQDLFTPLTIGSLRLHNRFAMAPMTRAASPGGIPGPDVAAYYGRRATGGTALIITEGVRIPHPAAGWPDAVPELDGAGSAARGLMHARTQYLRTTRGSGHLGGFRSVAVVRSEKSRPLWLQVRDSRPRPPSGSRY